VQPAGGGVEGAVLDHGDQCVELGGLERHEAMLMVHQNHSLAFILRST
jgi:hypothetical protein